MPTIAPLTPAGKAELRKRSLQLWMSVAERTPAAEFKLVDNTTVSGTLQGCDSKCQLFNTSELQTPMGAYQAAQLRSTDVQYITIGNWELPPLNE
ncbi:hypothetical protein HDU85_004911 [Gaertneriomyces sp. JEL0708]|nr:hypothetical protein HDU85_004911 [Gaertneriomyces sp. JEL0708]